ncbi:MAG: CopG family transcriptional regulator [Roseiflexaceae bacterium]|nr:CopG family transcriptional regulator [Roseiflexaceae bacterium]
MANVKTAISIEERLFERAEQLASEMKVSRSLLFTLAVEDFIRRRETQRIVERLNDVYGGEPDSDERQLLAGTKRLYTKTHVREEADE